MDAVKRRAEASGLPPGSLDRSASSAEGFSRAAEATRRLAVTKRLLGTLSPSRSRTDYPGFASIDGGGGGGGGGDGGGGAYQRHGPGPGLGGALGEGLRVTGAIALRAFQDSLHDAYRDIEVGPLLRCGYRARGCGGGCYETTL